MCQVLLWDLIPMSLHWYGSLNQLQTYSNTPSWPPHLLLLLHSFLRWETESGLGDWKTGWSEKGKERKKKKHSAFLLLSVPYVIKSKVKLFLCTTFPPPYTQSHWLPSNRELRFALTHASIHYWMLTHIFYISRQISEALRCSPQQAKSLWRSAA